MENFIQMIGGIHTNRSFSIRARRPVWPPGMWIAADWASERDAADLVDNMGNRYLPTLQDYLAEDWHVEYPKIKGLTLVDAVIWFQSHPNGTARRRNWNPPRVINQSLAPQKNIYLWICGDRYATGAFTPTVEDVLATDWEVDP